MDNHDQYNPIFYQYRKPTTKVSKFTIIGERHSGTNWIEKICLSRLTLPITWEFGSKHFINPRPSLLAAGTDCLFICIVRNIYDWIGGFYKVPHHVNVSMMWNIKTFILNEWKNDIEDNDYLTGKPYKNIFELRKYKLQYLSIFLPLIVDNMIIVRYEDLRINPENIVDFIATTYNIQKTNNLYSQFTNPINKPPYYFNKEILSIINDNTDWDIENNFGYYKSEYNKDI